MQVINWHQFPGENLPLGNKLSSVTIGIFDGVHRGHQALIKRIVSFNGSYVPVVITFRQPDNNKKHKHDIQTFEQKAIMLESLGVEILLVIDFSEPLQLMPGINFLETLVKHCNIGFFAAGSNFRCGYQLDTGAAEIMRFFSSFNVPAEIIPDVMEGSLPVSSSRIRSAIAAGDTRLAQVMLGNV